MLGVPFLPFAALGFLLTLAGQLPLAVGVVMVVVETLFLALGRIHLPDSGGPRPRSRPNSLPVTIRPGS